MLLTQLSIAPERCDCEDCEFKECFSVRWRPTNQKSAQARASTATPATTIPAIAPPERVTPCLVAAGEVCTVDVVGDGVDEEVSEKVDSAGIGSLGWSIIVARWIESSWSWRLSVLFWFMLPIMLFLRQESRREQ